MISSPTLRLVRRFLQALKSAMFPLRCTVRNCSENLTPSEFGLKCPSGHYFDRAKEGYWSLIQPQDRRSRQPGDADTAVLARDRWLARGHASGLVATLNPWIERSRSRADEACNTLDLGCGVGSLAPLLFASESAGYCGIDLSKRALRLAARSWPQATWVHANADRTLPAANDCVDRVLSLFGRRPVHEIRRVLRPDGVCIVAVPGEDDLIQLREHVQNAGHRRSRWEMVVEEMATAGMEFVEHQLWQDSLEIDRDEIADALAMTYRAGRHSEQSRLCEVSSMRVTLAADLLYLRRCN